ncbi:MAG TPA: hypothetical protein VLG76_04140 [Rhabdochlamydiaceae bacterium]|nr:hypothetical protein [Rhabdochlamydiaceae bacterium]
MDVYFDETKVASIGGVESNTPLPGRISLLRPPDSLEIPATPGDGLISRLFEKIVKFISKLINSFLILIRIRPKPDINREITGDEIYAKLDELIKHPDQFAAALGVYVPPSQSGNLKSINLKVYGDEIPLFTVLCFEEGKKLHFDDGKITITPQVIEYVLKKARGLDLRTEEGSGVHIFFRVRSEEVLRILLDRDSSLIDFVDRQGQTALFYILKYHSGRTIEECRKMVQLLIFRGAKLDLPNSEGNSILHFCRDQPTAELLLKADPGLVFALNKHYESPIDSALETLKPYLTEFAKSHQERAPKDKNKLLEIAIGKASHSHGGESFETLKTARTLIEAGADVSTRIKMDGDRTESVLNCIISRSNYEAWRNLLPIAIKKATQEQIHSSLKTTLRKAMEWDEEQHWIEAARALISASVTPCNGILLRTIEIDSQRRRFESQEKSLEEWDSDENWGLFPKR